MTQTRNPQGDAYTYCDRRRRSQGGFAMVYRDEIKCFRRAKLTGSAISLWLYLASKVSNNPNGWQIGERELIEALEMPRSTLYRSLAQLLAAGFVRRERGTNGRSWTRYNLVDPDPDLSAEEITKDEGPISGTPEVPDPGLHKDQFQRSSPFIHGLKTGIQFRDYESDRKFWNEYRQNNPPAKDLDPEAYRHDDELDMYAKIAIHVADLLRGLQATEKETIEIWNTLPQEQQDQLTVSMAVPLLHQRTGDDLVELVRIHSNAPGMANFPRLTLLSAIAGWRLRESE